MAEVCRTVRERKRADDALLLHMRWYRGFSARSPSRTLMSTASPCQLKICRWPRLVCAGKYESARKLMELVQHTESDAWLALSLANHLNMLPLSRQLSCITGYLWSRTLQACLHAPHTHPC